jgi:hypothetical protein
VAVGEVFGGVFVGTFVGTFGEVFGEVFAGTFGGVTVVLLLGGPVRVRALGRGGERCVFGGENGWR